MAQILLGGSIGVQGTQSVLGNVTITFPSDANYTLTAVQWANKFLDVNGTISATRSILAPLNQGQEFFVQNNTVGGHSIIIAPSSGGGSTVTIPNGAIVMVVCDGTNYIEPSALVTFSGDLSGSNTSQTVIGIQGNPVESITLSASQDGYVLTWHNASNQYQALPSSGTFAANGDLSGTGSSQTVIGIQGNSVSAVTPTAGQFLIENISATGSAWTSLSGDVVNSVSTAGKITVSKINGASVPTSGSLSTGNVLQVSGSSALTYGAINLAGGSNYVTGSLPGSNMSLTSTQIAFGSLGNTQTSDANLTWTDSTQTLVVGATQGTSSSINFNNDGYAVNLIQNIPTSDYAPQPITIMGAATYSGASINMTSADINIATGSAQVSGISIFSGGSGYSSAPTIAITGGGGTGATATCTISGGVVNSVTITNHGYGYTSPPTISVSGGSPGAAAQLLATMSFGAINIQPGGTTYLQLSGQSSDFLALGGSINTEGTNPVAQSGYIRLPYATSGLLAVRNASNNGDIDVFSINSGDGVLQMGGSGFSTTAVFGANYVQLGAGGYSIYYTGNQMSFATTGGSGAASISTSAQAVTAPLSLYAQDMIFDYPASPIKLYAANALTGGGVTNTNGGSVLIQGGNANNNGTTGLRGPVQITLGKSDYMFEATEVITGQRVISLLGDTALTTTQMPSNTGDLVVYMGNCNAAPTAPPVSGGILYEKAGSLTHYSNGSVIQTIAVAGSGTPNTQTGVLGQYVEFGTVTSSGNAIVLNVPLDTSTSNACITVNALIKIAVAGSGNSVGDTYGTSIMVFFKNVDDVISQVGSTTTTATVSDGSLNTSSLAVSHGGTNVQFVLTVTATSGTLGTADCTIYASATTN